MGKKGKGKKEKLTGTAEVIKFKGTKTFQLLKECVVIQESLPFVASDNLDEHATRKVARFVHMLGLLYELYSPGGVNDASVPGQEQPEQPAKDYRFQLHHRLASPEPQYFPHGYPTELISVARNLVHSNKVQYNNNTYEFPAEIQAEAESFLKRLDAEMTKVASFIEPCLKNDIAQGLKKFGQELKVHLDEFDALWCGFEHRYLQERLVVDNEIFRPVDVIYELELKLSAAEEAGHMAEKGRIEDEFADRVQDLVNLLYRETVDKSFHPSPLSLAEACVFYESKVTPEWLTQCKLVIKDYLELRTEVAKMSGDSSHRLNREYKSPANNTLTRLLKKFYASVISATDALAFVSQLPAITHTKKRPDALGVAPQDGPNNGAWMTKRQLAPDLLAMKDPLV